MPLAIPVPPSLALHTGLLLCGTSVWAWIGPALHQRPDLQVPLNIMGIHRSPYGEVLALAVQDNIDQSFQAGIYGSIGTRPNPGGSSTSRPPGFQGIPSMDDLIATMETAAHANTNPKPVSHAHRLYLRRQAETKLRFAYNLDPAQYSNYNSLHFFLTEPAVGTRKQLTPMAESLARQTISYCLRQDSDPRPALTAAAACTNLLDLMIADYRFGSQHHSTGEMRQTLDLLDLCLNHYETTARLWDESGHWQLLSTLRFQECQERHSFILKIRNAAATSVAQLENNSSTP